jgi:hypothetical protein
MFCLISKNTYFLLAFLFLFTIKLKAATCITTGSGLWTASGTWGCGAVPACGDSVVIQSGHTVSITSQDYKSCVSKLVIVIRGTLQFTAPGKLELSCTGRLYVFSGGKVIAALGATGNSNAIMQCNSTWWQAGAGTYNGPGCMPPMLPGCNNVLPIELLSFEGSVCEKNICLVWETISEKSNDHFEVQHSYDGSNFQTMSKIKSKSSDAAGMKLKYIAEDSQPNEGYNYYRLKQVDYDGSYKYFKIIEVPYQSAERVYRIYPNPNTGNFIISGNSTSSKEPVTLVLYNLFGKIVYSDVISVGKYYEVLLDGVLLQGVYICSLQSPKQNQTIRLVVAE